MTFTDQAPAAFVDFIRKAPNGKNIFVMGGGELARTFLRDDVVDELYIGVYPVLLGDGIPFFPSGFPQRDFRLVESKSLPAGRISGTEILENPILTAEVLSLD